MTTYGISIKKGTESINLEKDEYMCVSESNPNIIIKKPRINLSITKSYDEIMYLSVDEAKELMESLKLVLNECEIK